MQNKGKIFINFQTQHVFLLITAARQTAVSLAAASSANTDKISNNSGLNSYNRMTISATPGASQVPS